MVTRCHSSFNHYWSFHNGGCHCGSHCGSGSIFQSITINNGGGGYGGGSFWSGLAHGFCSGLAGLFGGFGMGMCGMFGGLGGMFGGWGMGGLGWGGGFGGWGTGGAGWSGKTDKTDKTDCEDKDTPKLHELRGELNKILDAKEPKEADLKALYAKVLPLTKEPLDDSHKAGNIDNYKDLLADIKRFADTKGWELDGEDNTTTSTATQTAEGGNPAHTEEVPVDDATGLVGPGNENADGVEARNYYLTESKQDPWIKGKIEVTDKSSSNIVTYKDKKLYKKYYIQCSTTGDNKGTFGLRYVITLVNTPNDDTPPQYSIKCLGGKNTTGGTIYINNTPLTYTYNPKEGILELLKGTLTKDNRLVSSDKNKFTDGNYTIIENNETKNIKEE